MVRGGFFDAAALRRAVDGVSEIYHCAGCSTDWAPWRQFHEGNVLAVEALLGAARECSTLRRLVHVSTTDVYGYPECACSEDGPVRDVGLPYNRSKVMGERRVWESGLPVTIVRPASIYGPYGTAFTADFAAHLRAGSMAVIGGGRSRAGLAYVDNVAAGMMAAASSSNTVGKAYNLADGTGVTWRGYVDALAGALGVRRAWMNLPAGVAWGLARAMEAAGGMGLGRPMLTRHAVRILSRDQEYPAARAREEFGYRAEVGFEEGVRRSAAWVLGVNGG